MTRCWLWQDDSDAVHHCRRCSPRRSAVVSLSPFPPSSHPDLLHSSTFRPTLTLCPAPVIEVWDSEVRQHFPQLRVMRWYNTPDKQTQKHIRDAILPTKAAAFLTWIQTECR